MSQETKVVVIGDGAVGKTTLLMSLTNDFSSHPVFETYRTHVALKGKEVPICLYDTGGQDDFDTVRPQSYMGADLIVVCYSVISPISFEHVRTKWLTEIRGVAATVPIVLLATKKDLRTDKDILDRLSSKGLNPITQAQGKTMAKEIGALKYVEVCSTNQNEVIEVLETSLQVLLKKSKKGEKKCRVM